MIRTADNVTFTGAGTQTVTFGPFRPGDLIASVLICNQTGTGVKLTGRVGLFNVKPVAGVAFDEGSVSSPQSVNLGAFALDDRRILCWVRITDSYRYFGVELTADAASTFGVWVEARTAATGGGPGGGGIVKP